MAVPGDTRYTGSHPSLAPQQGAGDATPVVQTPSVQTPAATSGSESAEAGAGPPKQPSAASAGPVPIAGASAHSLAAPGTAHDVPAADTKARPAPPAAPAMQLVASEPRTGSVLFALACRHAASLGVRAALLDSTSGAVGYYRKVHGLRCMRARPRARYFPMRADLKDYDFYRAIGASRDGPGISGSGGKRSSPEIGSGSFSRQRAMEGAGGNTGRLLPLSPVRALIRGLRTREEEDWVDEVQRAICQGVAPLRNKRGRGRGRRGKGQRGMGTSGSSGSASGSSGGEGAGASDSEQRGGPPVDPLPDDEISEELAVVRRRLARAVVRADRGLALAAARVGAIAAAREADGLRHERLRRLSQRWFAQARRAQEEREAAERQAEEDADACCAVCSGGESHPRNQIVFCESCDLAVHQECYGIPFIPEGDWFCEACAHGLGPLALRRRAPGARVPAHAHRPRDVRCAMCPVRGGALKPLAMRGLEGEIVPSGRWVHWLCAAVHARAQGHGPLSFGGRRGAALLAAGPQSSATAAVTVGAGDGSATAALPPPLELQFGAPDRLTLLLGLEGVAKEDDKGKVASGPGWLSGLMARRSCGACGSAHGVVLPCAYHASGP